VANTNSPNEDNAKFFLIIITVMKRTIGKQFLSWPCNVRKTLLVINGSVTKKNVLSAKEKLKLSSTSFGTANVLNFSEMTFSHGFKRAGLYSTLDRLNDSKRCAHNFQSNLGGSSLQV